MVSSLAPLPACGEGPGVGFVVRVAFFKDPDGYVLEFMETPVETREPSG